MKPKPQPTKLVLLNTRVVAALGLIGLGGTLGLTLLTARILPYVGFGVAAICAAGVIWMYAGHLKRAYQAISRRTPYRGPPPRELLIATGAAVFLLVLASWVLSIVLVKEPPSGRPILKPGIPTFVKLPSDAPDGFVNIQLRNTGQLDAERVRVLMIGHVSADGFTLDALAKEMDGLANAMELIERTNPKFGLHAQIRPNSSAVITLEDIPPDRFPKIADGSAKPQGTIMLSDKQWSEFQIGRAAIYVLFFAKYEDEAHSGNSYWSTRQCMYFKGAVTFRHNCDSNRIELKSGKR